MRLRWTNLQLLAPRQGNKAQSPLTMKSKEWNKDVRKHTPI